MNMRIGQLAEKSGCQVVTIRYYEKRGLLEAPARSRGNLRLYEDKDLRRLKFIGLCRENDISLPDIKILLDFMTSDTVFQHVEPTFFDQRLADIDRQIDCLTKLKACLEHLKISFQKGSDHERPWHQFQEAAVEFCTYCRTRAGQRVQKESFCDHNQ